MSRLPRLGVSTKLYAAVTTAFLCLVVAVVACGKGGGGSGGDDEETFSAPESIEDTGFEFAIADGDGMFANEGEFTIYFIAGRLFALWDGGTAPNRTGQWSYTPPAGG
jgi:hypothetical protein